MIGCLRAGPREAEPQDAHLIAARRVVGGQAGRVRAGIRVEDQLPDREPGGFRGHPVFHRGDDPVIADDVDLMIGVATPVAMRMQALTEDNEIPVVFSAVSDPVGAELVESLDKPGANVTGTSDYLDADAIMNLIFANDPDAKKIGLLYDVGQDSSAASIEAAMSMIAGTARSMGIEVVD